MIAFREKKKGSAYQVYIALYSSLSTKLLSKNKKKKEMLRYFSPHIAIEMSEFLSRNTQIRYLFSLLSFDQIG